MRTGSFIKRFVMGNNKSFIASIDVGTTNCKTIVYNIDGTIASSAAVETPNIYNRLGPGWVEQDSRLIWDAVCKTSKNAIERGNIEPQKISAIGITSFRQTVLPVDRNGNPIRYAIPWCVKSTHTQADWIKKNIGEELIHRITGVNCDPHWAAATFRYLIEEENDVYREAYKLVGIQDFILKRLGAGAFVQDYSHASTISLLDLATLEWSDEICNALELDIKKLPEVVSPGSIVGEVSSDAERLTGFKKGTPIIPGGGDCQCSAIGCGVISKGLGNVVIGTTAVGIIFADRPVFDPKFQLVSHAHSYPGKYIMQHTVLTGGGAYRWFRDLFCEKEMNQAQKDKVSPYKYINGLLDESVIGARGLIFLPHFVGAASPYWDDKARGVFLGVTQATSRADFARAILEGVVIEVAKGFELIKNLGLDINEVRLSGGACQKDSPWNQLQADIYGKPVLITQSGDTTSVGSAVLAGVAVGIFRNIEEGVKTFVKFVQRLEPDMNVHKQYLSLLKLHNKVFEALHESGVYALHSDTLELF
jgi:sugar (pentulose or hexulose) kinase